MPWKEPLKPLVVSTELKPKTWYALYTKPRWEKKVHELMLRRGVESYCPLNKVRRKWSDRYKMVEEPLFKSYLFVHVEERDKMELRYIDGVVNFVYWIGKPAVIREDDINRIKRFLNEHVDVQVMQLAEPKLGDKVVIRSGPFMEQSGTIMSTDKKKVEVRLDSLNCKLVAQVDRENISIRS